MTKLEHNSEECIGCGACTAINPDGWEMEDDGKSHIKNGVKANGREELTLTDEEDIKRHQEAAESCPVNCIHITDDKGEKII